MKTYTIAYLKRKSGARSLLALVPDGDAIIDLARKGAAMQGIAAGDKIFVHYKLALTNDEPNDIWLISWKEGVRDPQGNFFQYAVRTISGIPPRIIRLDRVRKGK